MMALGSAGGGVCTLSTLAAVRRRFPGWSAWRSDAGRCWATRVTGRPPGRGEEHRAMTVDGDTPRQLAQAIAAEEAKAPAG